nr:MAG TPA: minor capsid protein [Caudoviricetes sp.]
MMETTNLDKFLHTVRRIEEHREEKTVNQLKKLYKRLIKDLQSHLGTVYAKYSDENGVLTYARLHKDALDARLLQEVASKMNDVTQAEKKLITELVEQTYSNVYSGMVQAVDKAVDDKDLVTTFAQVQSARPQALRAAVNNPVHGLTLSAQLEKNRANIIYGIQQAVGIGLSVGDRYDTMAKRVQKTLIGDDGAGGSYAKSIRIVRTEAHRVREQGNQDAAKELNNRLEPEGFEMVKTWHTMKDERVRPNVSRKNKKGWKYSIGNGKYNHVKMEGQSVLVNEPFTLPSGATAMSPGMSGIAGEDINCRCFVSYEVRKRFENAPKNNSLIKGGKGSIMKPRLFKMNIQLFAEKDLKNQSSSSLKKAIRNFEKRISEHKEYIRNPVSHCPDWETKDPRGQQGLIKHWKKEISNFNESIQNRIDELKKRGEY